MASVFGKLLTVGNLKGGVGKSTVAVHLAASMSSGGQRVCVVDCDPQLTSAHWLVGGSFDIHVIGMPINKMTHAKLWVAHVRKLASQFDLIVIDLPAVVGPALASAMLVSHLVVIPLQVTGIDIHATQRMLQFIEATRREREETPPQVLMVPNRVPLDVHGSPLIDEKLRHFKQPVTDGLRDDSAFADAFDAKRWVGQMPDAQQAKSDVDALAIKVGKSLDVAPTPPVLAAKVSMMARLTGQAPPIGNLGDNHQKGLSWWRSIIASG